MKVNLSECCNTVALSTLMSGATFLHPNHPQTYQPGSNRNPFYMRLSGRVDGTPNGHICCALLDSGNTAVFAAGTEVIPVDVECCLCKK
jgi:hypothetical protein